MPKIVNYFSDLKRRGFCHSWPHLKTLVEQFNFPPGRFVASRRTWGEEELTEWWEAQPTERPERSTLRGGAKINVEAKAKGKPRGCQPKRGVPKPHKPRQYKVERPVAAE